MIQSEMKLMPKIHVTKWIYKQAFTPVLFRVLILSEPFVSQPLMVNFVRNLVHFGFSPSSEALQFF